MSKKRIITFNAFPGPDEGFATGRKYSLFRGTKGSNTTYSFKLKDARYEVNADLTKMSLILYPDGKVTVSKKNCDGRKLVDNIGYFVMETDTLDYAKEYGLEVTLEIISNIFKGVIDEMKAREKDLIEQNHEFSKIVNDLLEEMGRHGIKKENKEVKKNAPKK